jgi:hypothetical protein
MLLVSLIIAKVLHAALKLWHIVPCSRPVAAAFSSIFRRCPSDAAGSAAFTAFLQSLINEVHTLNPGGTTPAQIVALNIFVEGRGSNQAVTNAKGFDFDVRYRLDTDSLGAFSFGFAGTLFTSYHTAATATAPVFDVLNSITYPLQFRGRAFAGWRNSNGWNARLALNYAGGYRNDLATPKQRTVGVASTRIRPIP